MNEWRTCLNTPTCTNLHRQLTRTRCLVVVLIDHQHNFERLLMYKNNDRFIKPIPFYLRQYAVYLFYSPEQLLHKIGLSTNVVRRVQTIKDSSKRYCSPDVVLIQQSAYILTCSQAHKAEKYLHKCFDDRRMPYRANKPSEWFALTYEDVEYIKRFLSRSPQV
jgi:hypothetical protein